MKAISIMDYNTPEAINKFALRNYKTYMEHYRARKLRPMPLEEFLENYNR